MAGVQKPDTSSIKLPKKRKPALLQSQACWPKIAEVIILTAYKTNGLEKIVKSYASKISKLISAATSSSCKTDEAISFVWSPSERIIATTTTINPAAAERSKLSFTTRVRKSNNNMVIINRYMVVISF